MADRAIEPLALAPDEGLSVENPAGGVLTFKLMSDDCGGVISAAASDIAVGEGPPLHVHRDQDEFIYFVAGAFRAKLADRLVDAPPRSFIFIPRGTPHTWQNIGDGPGHFFVAVLPASPEFEQFFVRYGELPQSERGVEAFVRLGRETGALEVVGPPLSVSDPL
ncbi:MAG TPA: cupin domain-containing protein [Solirubrobacteraceae bacterium]|jgi:mannose-6-phosphate isomerase-like protein (cupin superfamily)|nr:cupin domain-containing protein [Solirubrobacteraceae bacterium]